MVNNTIIIIIGFGGMTLFLYINYLIMKSIKDFYNS